MKPIIHKLRKNHPDMSIELLMDIHYEIRAAFYAGWIRANANTYSESFFQTYWNNPESIPQHHEDTNANPVQQHEPDAGC
jgi:hypothetical protein